MKLGKAYQSFKYVGKSKFIRSIFFETISVFLVVILAVVAILFLSFGAEINEAVISDQKNQLDIVEDTISSRMEEATSIAYNVGDDPMFYLEPVEGVKYSGYEMSRQLSRYLVGNRFIEHLAYYRLSEPDKIYTSNGEMSLHGFWGTYINCDNYIENSFLEQIKTGVGVQFLSLISGGETNGFVYVNPLPQFSVQPQAFVIALIPLEGIDEPLSAQLKNDFGEISVYDARGDIIYTASTLEEDISVPLPEDGGDAKTELAINGSRYEVQSKRSGTNSWIYVSAVRLDSIFSVIAGKQILVILVLAVLMIVAVFVVLLRIVNKYRPISNLAMTLTDPSERASGGGVVDEKELLSSTIETLKSDSEQKQRFEAAYQEASEASRAKSVFLSNVSHDIRTPMNAIIGMMGLAQRHIDDPEYVSECLQKADVASHYLLELINNVLDMSRIEAGKLTLAEAVVHLPELVYGLITIVNTNIAEKHQKLIVDTDNIVCDAVIGDAVRLTQICMNILSNAIKFTPEGGTIRMTISQRIPDGQDMCELKMVFEDTGIGMTPDFVNIVFDSFSRAKESGSSQIGGTGLGMAIAKNLVDMMSGEISCESELGKGTVFTVILPMRLAPEEPVSGGALPRNASVLIFGGDREVSLHQAQMFEGLGVSAAYAPSLDTAARRVKDAALSGKPYTYVLLNLISDDKNGVDSAAELINAAEGTETKVILSTTDFSDIDKNAASAAGIDFYIRAPLFRSAVIGALAYSGGASAENKEADAVSIDLNGKRILLAEDNDMNRLIASRIISEVNAEVVEAENGKQAVRAFAEHPAGYFDMILMDVQMPEMDGLEATAAIRAMDREDAATTPIYAMTANTFDEDVREVMNSGMNGHIGKPYSPDELYRVLSDVLLK